MHERLATRARAQMGNGNAHVSCLLCEGGVDAREHLFFECAYSCIEEFTFKSFLQVQVM